MRQAVTANAAPATVSTSLTTTTAYGTTTTVGINTTAAAVSQHSVGSLYGQKFYLCLDPADGDLDQIRSNLTELHVTVNAFFDSSVNVVVVPLQWEVMRANRKCENQIQESRYRIAQHKLGAKIATIRQAIHLRIPIWSLKKLNDMFRKARLPAVIQDTDVLRTQMVSRPDIRFLRAPFILVADAAGVHKPVHVKEFTQDSPVPRIHYDNPAGTSPFLELSPEQRQDDDIKQRFWRHSARPFVRGNKKREPKRQLVRRQSTAAFAKRIEIDDHLPAVISTPGKRRKRRHYYEALPDSDESVLKAIDKCNYAYSPKKPGFCEICNTQYGDHVEHVLTGRHRRKAEDQVSWRKLDLELLSLEREPLPGAEAKIRGHLANPQAILETELNSDTRPLLEFIPTDERTFGDASIEGSAASDYHGTDCSCGECESYDEETSGSEYDVAEEEDEFSPEEGEDEEESETSGH